MSHVREPLICYCECHNPRSGTMHCVPCCEGECPVCKKNYTDERHVEACKARIAELIKQREQDEGK
jgi:hypothetical protein